MADPDNSEKNDLGSFRPATERTGVPAASVPTPRPVTQRPLTRPPNPPLRDVETPSLRPPSAGDVGAQRDPIERPTTGRVPLRRDDEQLPRIARTGPLRAAPPRPLTPPRQPARPSYDDFEDDDGPERRRWGRIIGASVLGVIVLAGAAVVAVLAYMPTDLVRDRLIREVKAKTGRDLVIGKSPRVTFWPQVAVSLGDVTLANPSGMGGAPLVTMERLDATIQLWPLLQKRVQVDQLVLQSPTISLSVDGQGRRNWDFASLDLGARRPIRVAQAGKLDLETLPEELREFAKGSATYRTAAATTPDGFSLGRVRILDGTVRHFDERSGVVEEARAIDMTLDAPDLAGPLQATGSLVWRGEAVRIDGRAMPARALLQGAPVQATAAFGAGPLHATFAGTIAPSSGGTRIEGAVTAKSPALAKAAQWFGRPIAGEPASGPMSFKGRVSSTVSRLGVSDGSLQMPGLNLTGGLAVETTGTRPKVTGSVRVAELSLDALASLKVLEPNVRPNPRSFSPRVPPGPAQATPRSGPTSIEDLLKETAPAQVRGFVKRDGWSDEPIDISGLGQIDGDVKISFTRLSGALAGAGPGQVGVTLVDRVLKISLDDVSLHEGKLRGTVALDGAAQRPAATINLTADGVQLQPLLKDFGSEGLDGRARVTMSLSTSGRSERQMIDGLSGKAEFLVPRGAFVGVDVGQMVQGIARGQIPRLEKVAGARTEFTDLGASFGITRGVADNRDFRVVTRDVRAIGNGQIALGARTIDVTVRPKLSGAAQAPAGAGGSGLSLDKLDLPIRIVGPFDKPQVSADFSALLRNPGEVVDALKTLDRNEVQDTVKGVLAGDEAAKKKARDFLNNLIKR